MKYLIIYFSGTGNTWFMANSIKEQLGIHQTEMYSIENEKLIQSTIDEAEHLVIGYPVYGSEAPAPMKLFIDNLSVSSKKKNVSIFCTQAYMSGDGANYLEENLLSKNYILSQTQEFKLSNNFYVPIFVRAFKVGNQKKIDIRNDKALEVSRRFVLAIQNGEKRVKHVGLFNQMMGNLQRKHIGSAIKKVNETLLADDSCTRCGMCVKLCPVDNITLNERIEFSSHCVACMRCYQSCPVSAIQLTEASKDLDKYPRYKGPTEKFKFTVVKY